MASSKGSGIRIIYFDEKQKLTTSIRNITIESVESFQDLSSCISFIEQQTQENNVIILITTTLDENILQTFESLKSIEAILILSTIDKNLDILPSKVIGIYQQMELLSRALVDIFDMIEIQLNVKNILFNSEKNGNDNLIFYFYYLWKNYIKDENNTKKSFIDHARHIFYLNNQIKSSINEFETLYKSNEVLNWIDKHRRPFPYHLLISNALRIHDHEILSLSRFFLNDLNKQLKPSPPGSSHNQVYLGTKLPLNLIDQLDQSTKTDIIAFQCFLMVTRSRANALLEATRTSRQQTMINVLFKIDLNNTLCITIGENVLIDMATPFRILCVTRSTGASGNQQLLTIIKLIALNKNDKDQLYEQFILRQEKLGRTIDDLWKRITLNISDDEALADEHIARGEWSQAANIFARIMNPNVRILNKYGCLLREHLNNLSGALECHQQALLIANDREKAETLIYLGLIYNNMKQYAEAYKVYCQALQWFENEKKEDFVMIARCLVGLGNVQWARQQLDEALNLAERALAIREHKIKPKNDFDIAACLGNMGNILHDQGDIERALSCTKRAVDLLSVCGKGDPRYAAALNNLGAMYQANDDFIKAREYFQRALECLPNENHPNRKSTLANIARLNKAEQLKK